jgi:protein gp37
MGDTSIEWTDKVWNPVRGCSEVSPGCGLCYARVMAARFSDPGLWGHTFAERTENGGSRWTGKVALIPDKLAEPLSWRKPARCFVNSTSDLFHEALSFEDIAAVYGVMAACPHITFQVLTKRPERRWEFYAWAAEQGAELLAAVGAEPPGGSPVPGAMALFLEGLETRPPIDDLAKMLRPAYRAPWPLPNAWEGASCETQKEADERIPHLLATPAAVRFLSLEPLLGPIDLRQWIGYGRYEGNVPGHCVSIDGESLHLGDRKCRTCGWGFPDDPDYPRRVPGIAWVIVGGESGHGARPMHPEWARSLRDQCAAAGVPFFFKQWGEWGSGCTLMGTGAKAMPRQFADFQQWVNKASTWIAGGTCVDLAGRVMRCGGDMMHARDEGTFPVAVLHREGKKEAGRLLDGREWSEFPEVPRA